MRTLPVHSVIAAVAVPLLCAICAAQQPPAGKTAANSDEIVLPVVVLDHHEAPVPNIVPGELTLTDNGRVQTIKSFHRASESPLHVGLLVDTSGGMQRALEAERQAVGKFVESMLGGGPSASSSSNQMFLIHFDREVELLQDFTDSRAKIQSNLEQMGPTQAAENRQGPETSDSDEGGASRNSRRGAPQLYDAIYLAADELMKSKHGGKALIVFSNGVDGGSRESLNEAIDAAQRVNLPVYTIYFRGDERRGEGGGFPGGRRGGIGGGLPGTGGGWPGGGGGYPGGSGRGPTLPQTDGRKIMQQIATRTGGLYFEAKKTAELPDIYDRIATDLRAGYLLTYTPAFSDNQPSFHKVELKAVKGDFNISAPEGYYAVEDNSK
jgi:VWFA-related protein